MRLNIGAGTTSIEGFENVDIKAGKDASKLEYADNSVDEIYASHILEHFPHKQTMDVLKEWCRVLVPGGRLRVSVPDFDKLVDEYLTNKSNERVWTEGVLMGGQVDGDDFHKAIFQKQKLTELMDVAGFDDIEEWNAVLNDCSSLPISLNLQGTKRKGPRRILPKNVPLKPLRDTCAVMTLPRVCWTDPAFIIQPICSRLQMSMVRSTGVYWDQKLTAAMLEAIKRAPKYLVVFDYDSILTDRDVIAMHDIMEANPDIAALCPLQIRRENDYSMFTMSNPDGTRKESITFEEVAIDAIDIDTGHFGATFIRAESLRKMPEPWFIGETLPDGTWGEGHIDADIYFWKKLKKHGLRACCAPGVSIGHLQLMVAWPMKDFKPTHQYLSHWEKSGKPEEAV